MRITYPKIEQLLERVERLERQNRRTRRLAGVMGIILLAVVVMGAQTAMQDGHFRKIIVQEVTIVDSKGVPRVMMGSSDEGTGIRVLNQQGKRVVGFGLSADERGSGMLVADNNGNPRIGLGMDDEVPSIAIVNEDGKKVIGLGGGDDGYGFVVMDANEVERVGFGIDGKGNTGFVLYDDQGQYVRGMIRQKDGVHYSSYINENGEEVVHR
jgi:hypothetical protein